MRVAIIALSTGKIAAYGECDGKRYDDIYVKVFREGVKDTSPGMTLTPAVYVYPAEHVEAVASELRAMALEEGAMRDRHYREQIALHNKYGVVNARD